MPELKNSQRQINTATYVQIRRDDSEKDQELSKKVKRPLEKVNFLRSLAVDETELPLLYELLDEVRDENRREKLRFLLDIATRLATDTGAGSNLRYASQLKDISPETLEGFGRFLVDARRKFKTEVKAILDDLRTSYAKELYQESSTGLVAMKGDLTFDGPSVDNQPQVTESIREDTTTGDKMEMGVASARLLRKGSVRLGMSEPVPAETERSSPSETYKSSFSPTKPTRRSQPNLKDVLAWAVAKDDERITQLAKRGIALELDDKWDKPTLAGAAETYVETPGNQWNVSKHPDQTETAIDQFVQQMKIEPVGRLHLERLTMTPAGIERGELQYSVPLAPKETVNISHKEWSTRSEEFEKIVQDVFEEYSEEGVAEKKELAQSTDSQQKHASAYTLSGSYSYAGSAKVAFGYKSSSEDQNAIKDSLKENKDITSKSSSRSKKDHKYSFKVESAYGSEDQSIRIITNPSKTEVMRVDYYQLMRKWQVDLYRYDLRMTYDIVIPSPGAELMQKLVELRALDDDIEKPFTFPVMPSNITQDNWFKLAGNFGAKVNPPPKDPDEINKSGVVEWQSSYDVAKNPTSVQVDFWVDPDYMITSGCFSADFGSMGRDDEDDEFHQPELEITGEKVEYGYSDKKIAGEFVRNSLTSKLESFYGKSGDLSLIYTHRYISHGTFLFTLTLKPTDEAYQRWQYEAWNAMREAAEEQYFEKRQILAERRERLAEEINQWDALTLRQMEREAIMKGVLRWLLGPDFEFGLPDADEPSQEAVGPYLITPIKAIVYGNSEKSSLPSITPTEENWERVIRYGEFIKFVHHAIEWENMLYFTYPYFWDLPENWDFKRFLQHPDPRHREFLRAGSARVVLTIRPGYETEFTKLMETGELLEDLKFLFSGGLTFRSELDQGTLSEELQQEFEGQGFPLSENVDLVTEVAGNRWRINDEGKTYIIIEENSALNIYDQPIESPYLSIAEEIQNYARTNYPGVPPANPPDNFRTLLLPKQIKAWRDLQRFKILLEKHYEIQDKKQRSYPLETEWLDAVKSCAQTLADAQKKDPWGEPWNPVTIPDLDPWGNEWVYIYPGIYGDFDVASYGANGEPGGEGEDADITGWAEASLIGRWYEYTPTSALDISINSSLDGLA